MVLHQTNRLLALLLITAACIAHGADARVEEQEAEYYREKGYSVLQGDQDGEYPRGVYLITDKAIIPAGKSMALHPGSILLFKKDARLVVRGALEFRGAENALITLGKLDNQKYYFPLPPELEARWDGVYLESGARLVATYTTVSQSTYGITASADHGGAVFDSVTFIDNQVHDLRFGDAEIDYPDGYRLFATIEPGETPRLPGVSSRPARWKPVVRIGSAAALVGGGLIAALSHRGALDHERRYDDLGPEDDFDAHERSYRATLAGRGAGLALAVLGAAGVTVTFLF